ncbi:hypothetical protein OIU78_002036 [Salix suchowensis]|nr:hypothetical protein OIU78_002036 [Salix suchowensis]
MSERWMYSSFEVFIERNREAELDGGGARERGGESARGGGARELYRKKIGNRGLNEEGGGERALRIKTMGRLLAMYVMLEQGHCLLSHHFPMTLISVERAGEKKSGKRVDQSEKRDTLCYNGVPSIGPRNPFHHSPLF